VIMRNKHEIPRTMLKRKGGKKKTEPVRKRSIQLKKDALHHRKKQGKRGGRGLAKKKGGGWYFRGREPEIASEWGGKKKTCMLSGYRKKKGTKNVNPKRKKY